MNFASSRQLWRAISGPLWQGDETVYTYVKYDYVTYEEFGRRFFSE